MGKVVTIELLQSQWNRKYYALSVDGTRVSGPDAGPWTVRQSFSVAVDDLLKAVRPTHRHHAPARATTEGMDVDNKLTDESHCSECGAARVILMDLQGPFCRDCDKNVRTVEMPAHPRHAAKAMARLTAEAAALKARLEDAEELVKQWSETGCHHGQCPCSESPWNDCTCGVRKLESDARAFLNGQGGGDE